MAYRLTQRLHRDALEAGVPSELLFWAVVGQEGAYQALADWLSQRGDPLGERILKEMMLPEALERRSPQGFQVRPISS